MKGSFALFCMASCLLLALIPAAGAECPVIVTITLVPPTAPSPDGSIYVESSPAGAVIFINGANQGHAPVTVRNLWPGTYTVTAELSGYERYTTSTTISGATRSSIYCLLVPENTGSGLYVVSTPPRATVFIDGVRKGVTPLLMSSPASGSHTIEVRLDGYGDWKSTVDVHEGGTKTIAAILKQTDPDSNRGINVTSKPAGAKVILDGLAKGNTPVSLKGIAAGIHILELEYPDYLSWKSTIDVPEAGFREIGANLTPKAATSPGWITVFSDPDNASVMLDGSYVGRTMENSSLNLDAIPPGEHTILLTLPGYRQYSTQVTVSSNLVSTVHANLMPVPGPVTKGSLSVASDPAGATVFLDNTSIGVSPLTRGDITVGNHQITVQKEGYQDYRVSVYITAGANSTISTTLMKGSPSAAAPVSPLIVFGALGVIGFFSLGKKR